MKVKQGQSFLDMVVQGTGSIENAFEMSIANERSITDELAIGEEIAATSITNKIIQKLLSQNEPATAIANYGFDYNPVADGIGAMIIEETFIVR